MEEADILSDRIAIMDRGKLRCIGTSVRLKSRFGTGFVVNVSVHKGRTRNDFLQNVSDCLQRETSGHGDILPLYRKAASLYCFTWFN